MVEHKKYKQILSAVKKAMNNGYTITAHEYGTESEKLCCPLRALLLSHGDKSSEDTMKHDQITKLIARRLDKSDYWVKMLNWAIDIGDDIYLKFTTKDTNKFKNVINLGLAIRKELFNNGDNK